MIQPKIHPLSNLYAEASIKSALTRDSLGLTYKINKKLDFFTEAVYAGSITSSEGNLGLLGVRIGTRRLF